MNYSEIKVPTRLGIIDHRGIWPLLFVCLLMFLNFYKYHTSLDFKYLGLIVPSANISRKAYRTHEIYKKINSKFILIFSSRRYQVLSRNTILWQILDVETGSMDINIYTVYNLIRYLYKKSSNNLNVRPS